MLRKPVSKGADFKGLKMRDVGPDAKFYKALGAEVVYIKTSEVYSALQTGVLDAAGVSSMGWMYAMKLYEVAKYVLWPGTVDMGAQNIFVNMDAWKSLPDDLKAILFSAARNFDYGRWGYDEDMRGLKDMVANHGVTIVSIPQSDMEKARKDVWADYAAADATAAKAMKILEDFRNAQYR
jgi:TRAP-type C4-dicarboxylate transport system substrate-binding protein